MEITNVDIKVPQTDCVARVSITIDTAIRIDFIKIMEGKKGVYVQWPKSIVFVDKDEKKDMSNRILATYVCNYCIGR